MSDPIVRPPVTLLTEEFRALGHHLINAIADHLSAAGTFPPVLGRPEMDRLLAEPLPREPTEPGEVFGRLLQDVVPITLPLDHPRFLAFVPGPSNPIGVLADLVATGFNLFGGTWLEAAGPIEAELQALGWLREILGLPATSEGVFVPGGSMANLTALAVARDRTADWRRGVVYGSDQTHSSVWKACRILGLLESQQRRLPTDTGFRIEISALEAALRDDAAKGRPPIAIVATAGTTNTGAVDPLDGLAGLAARSEAWLHVDGAYGLAAILDPDARTLLSGVERADSIALDPHKWWFQPYECGVVLCRNGIELERTYTARAEYLKAIDGVPEEPNMCDRSVQLSRRVVGLKFWASLKVFGMDAFAQAVRNGIRLAEHAQRRIEASSQWTLVSGAQLAVVTFRHVDGDGATEAAVARANATGTTFLATTSVRGQTVTRFCTINPRTTEDDIDAVLAAMG